jgi:hypothetical protein
MRLHIPEGQPQPREVHAVPRPASLAGLRIGLLDNTKAPVDKMLAHLDKRLHERIPGVQTVHYAKREMGIPAPEALLAQLQQVDVVINALGD